ncbi:protein MODIFIED TRANSPORT TO THE VACUOLE 1-like [Telopea speciosissima]|uniref:protein MODIFIED TRANSPORT TO THE VACUOLE 1-like n=1 Tax=Telopea speciosissima TaxID=54955 RepID=UPI001CC7B299|nr:protein MODIFIED TRANSPORT TO THE VACUOLE 1-like [Telopea speciosissima]XP_043704198.1 protein MODIFIED TRANSPORT TO THE VACUOLE 1-like [Telopea speciosissima]
MDSSRRGVESYWRSRMIDAATSDEEKVTPVYKLEEICELLRSSHFSIVKEVSEFILKRLDHKSPIVKQKALRLIKYAVGKSGVEFRREMQRHSVAVRQLFHYKGQSDPLKGDALNKAVRDTAHEAISAIFAEEESKPAQAEDLNKRIQGFGNTNFEMPSEDKKSFLSEVVGIGSASIKQGLSSITAAHSFKKSDNGSYQSPNLRRSLTTETDNPERYERFEHQNETQASSGISKNLGGGPWGQDSRGNMKETTNGSSSSSYSGSKTREERLLETVVTSGGVRLQPSRDTIQAFLVEASKLDAITLSHALESKLQSPMWQVRMKAVCVLESILRKKGDTHFSTVAIYFSENKDSVVGCSESPQASLREKANKVLSLLDGEQNVGVNHLSEKTSSLKDKAATVVQMPDLIDTSDADDSYRKDDYTEMQSDQSVADLMTPTTSLTDDLFGDSLMDVTSNQRKNDDNDLFAGVLFHTPEDGENVTDLFSGLTVDENQVTNDIHLTVNKSGSELLDIFGPNTEVLVEPISHKKGVNDIMSDLSTSNGKIPDNGQQHSFSEAFSHATRLSPHIQSSHPVPNDALNGLIGSQMVGMNPNAVFSLGPMQCGLSPNVMFNPAFASQPMNYGVMGNYIAQQQLLATMTNFQQLENLSAQGNVTLGRATGNSGDGGYSSPLPDIFHPNVPTQVQSTLVNNSKKEDSKAFDFISDHLSEARGAKRVI